MGLAKDFLDLVDGVVTSAINTGYTGITNYVLPAGWTLMATMLLVHVVLVIYGKAEGSLSEYFTRYFGLIAIMLLVGKFYFGWLLQPAYLLQGQLSSVVMGVSPATGLDVVDQQIQTIWRSCITSISSIPTTFGIPEDITSVLGLLIIAALAILTDIIIEIVAVLNLTFAKLGIALVLMVGPFAIMSLMVNAVKGWFFSWLNTVYYFVMYSVMTNGWVLLAMTLINKFLEDILKAAGAPAAATGAGGVMSLDLYFDHGTTVMILLVKAVGLLIVACVLALFGRYIPSIAQSVSGGSGGAFSGGAALISTVNKLVASGSPPPNDQPGESGGGGGSGGGGSGGGGSGGGGSGGGLALGFSPSGGGGGSGGGSGSGGSGGGGAKSPRSSYSPASYLKTAAADTKEAAADVIDVVAREVT